MFRHLFRTECGLEPCTKLITNHAEGFKAFAIGSIGTRRVAEALVHLNLAAREEWAFWWAVSQTVTT